MCVYVCIHICPKYTMSSEEGVESPEAGVTGGCELPDVGPGN